MKHFTSIFILLMSINIGFTQNEFINLRGDTVKIQDKECYFITLSSVSCHRCYEEIDAFLTYYNYYDNNNIYIICMDEKINISTVLVRKYLQSIVKQYFPNINKSKIIFKAIDTDEDAIFQYKIDIKGIPIVFHKTNSGIKKYSYEEFIDK